MIFSNVLLNINNEIIQGDLKNKIKDKLKNLRNKINFDNLTPLYPDERINLEVESSKADKKSGLEIKEGCQKVDGLTALAYSRMRYADPKGDIGRTERQQEVVTQIMKKSLSPFTLLNPLRAPQTISAIANAVTVNKGVGPFDLVPLVFALRSGGIDAATLPNKSGGNIGNLGSTRVITEDAKEVLKCLKGAI